MAPSLSLKFPYIKGRPFILVKLGTANENLRYFRLLIDSGADYTLISEKDGQLFGLDYNDIYTKEIKIEMADSSFIHAKKKILLMNIEGVELKVTALITKENVECLMGRQGVFENFDILFKEVDQEVVFTKR